MEIVFNVDKCKVMHVGNWEDSRTITWKTESKSVVSCEKDLGVWISADMKCSKQCMYACNKAMKVLGMIKRTTRFKDTRVMLSLYKPLVIGLMLTVQTTGYRPHVDC